MKILKKIKKWFELSPTKEPSDLGPPVPVLAHKDNPFYSDVDVL